MRRWPVFIALWFAGCAEEPREAAAEATDSAAYDIAPMIFNGVSSGEGAVVALVDGNGDLVCSGTAVRSDLILTAAHCFDGVTITEVLEGATVTAPTRRYSVAQTLVNPGYNAATGANDIGVVRLGSPFRGSLLGIGTPRAGLGQLAVGAALRVVGFGFDQNNVSGRRREATVSLTSVLPRIALTTNTAAGTCAGDSGGPMIANVAGRNRVVAVTAGILPPANPVANPCVGDGFGTRVDAYLGWLSTL